MKAMNELKKKEVGMLCAIATDDGVHLMARHFGNALRYDLYRIQEKNAVFQETILNPFLESDEGEDFHGDRKKASNMKELFLEKGVSVLVSKRFGPNVKRMVKNFVPVIVRHDDLEKAKSLLIVHFKKVQQMFGEIQKRQPIILK